MELKEEQQKELIDGQVKTARALQKSLTDAAESGFSTGSYAQAAGEALKLTIDGLHTLNTESFER